MIEINMLHAMSLEPPFSTNDDVGRISEKSSIIIIYTKKKLIGNPLSVKARVKKNEIMNQISHLALYHSTLGFALHAFSADLMKGFGPDR